MYTNIGRIARLRILRILIIALYRQHLWLRPRPISITISSLRRRWRVIT
jgi:hypothetical protein